MKGIPALLLSSLLLTGCATSVHQAQAQQTRLADARYNRCVDQIHDRAKTENIVWSREIDICLGKPVADAALDLRTLSREQLRTLSARE